MFVPEKGQLGMSPFFFRAKTVIFCLLKRWYFCVNNVTFELQAKDESSWILASRFVSDTPVLPWSYWRPILAFENFFQLCSLKRWYFYASLNRSRAKFNEFGRPYLSAKLLSSIGLILEAVNAFVNFFQLF